MDFDTERQKKFDRGASEHGQPWAAAHIDARREMQGELLDLFNYAGLLDDEVMKVRIQLWCRDICRLALKASVTREDPRHGSLIVGGQCVRDMPE